MKKSIRLISVVLALILSLSCISVTSASAATYKGNSGSIKWTVNTSTKKLTIEPKKSGNKCAIPKYSSNPPWYKHKKYIVHIVIKNGITTITQGAFSPLSSAKDISIGKDVNTISSFAFTGCSALTKFSVNSSNKDFTTASGVLFTKSKKTLYSYPRNKSGSSYTIPSSVTYLKHCAFYGNKNLTTVSQSTSSVTSIGDKAFKNCAKLKKVVIKNNCTSLGEEVFLDSPSLTTVKIPPSVTSISDSGKTLFSASSKMKNMTVYVAPNSTIKTKLSGKGYNLKDEDYKFTCNFNPVGGTVNVSKKTVTFGKEYGDLPIAQKTGYSFDGWYLNSSEIIYSTKVKTAKSHTLQAHYTGREYKIAIEPNGGTCSYNTVNVTFGERYGILPTPTRDGYAFLGWYTSDNRRITVNSVYDDDSVKTLYAHWLKNMVAVKNLKIKYKTKSKVKLIWNKQPSIAGYKVYRKVKGKFKLVKKTKSSKYISPKLNPKKKYTYKVRAYRTENGKTKYSPYSNTVKRNKTYIPKVKIKTKKKGRLFKVYWKSTGATKYVIYQKVKNKWKKALTTSSRSFSFYYNYNKKYSFRIRGYKNILGHKFYSKYSVLTKNFNRI